MLGNSLLLLFIALYCVRLCENKNMFTTCSYKFSKDAKEVPVFSTFQNTSSGNFLMYMNLCDTIPVRYCGNNVNICIRNKKDDTLIIAGYKLEPVLIDANISSEEKEDSLYLSELTSPHCQKIRKFAKVEVRFEREDVYRDQPRLIVNDDCDFEIRMLHPAYTPKCTIRVYDLLIDLKPLKNIYHVVDEIGNFSIGLCRSNSECDDTGLITSCLFRNAENIPLSTTENIQYHDDGEIIVRGKFKDQQRKNDRILEIKIKCDWSQSEPILYFVKMPIQDKTFHFEMLSSYVCLKLDSSSEIRNGHLIFNFDSLYKRNDYWRINLTHEKQIFLNIFGPLVLPNEDNNCSKMRSQVCFKNGSELINLGSIQTPLKINNDVVFISFRSGISCVDKKQEHFKHIHHHRQTNIEFICDNYEREPELISMEACETNLKWRTPQACPVNEKPTCKKALVPYENCVLDLDDHFYNITGFFKKNDKYIIKDPNENIQYLLNICGPVFDDNVPCNNNNSVFLKNIAEADSRKRLVSLGKMKKMYVQNQHLVVEMTSGGLCHPHDYQSIIYFECSNKEEQPQLKNRTECRFEFLWRTAAACPIIKRKTDSRCVFVDNSTSQMVDLRNLKREHYMKLEISGVVYIFDLCNAYKSKCSLNEGCFHLLAKKYLLNDGVRIFVEFSLNRTCQSPHEFNRTLLELVCDPIKNNDHYGFPEMTNCTMTFKLWTNLVCKENSSYYINGNIENHLEEEKSNETVQKNCSVSNPRTHHTINIMQLNLNFTVNKCPSYKFKYSKNFTELTYITDQLCQGNEDRRFQYNVLLKCSNHVSQVVQRMLCQENHIFEDFQYCKLLEDNPILVRSMHWTVITGIVCFILLSVVCITWVYFKYIRHKKRYCGVPYETRYCKYADN